MVAVVAVVKVMKRTDDSKKAVTGGLASEVFRL